MKKKDEFLNHFTGFGSHTDFNKVLNFIFPDLDRKRLVYLRSSQAKASYINTEKLFTDSESDDSDAYNELNHHSLPSNHSFPMTRVVSHLLPIEIEFLLTQMKIRMGLSSLDLAERFQISAIINPSHSKIERFQMAKVTNTLLIWINYLYLSLGSLTTRLSMVILNPLIGVDPKGGILFVSKLYEGSISDKKREKGVVF